MARTKAQIRQAKRRKAAMMALRQDNDRHVREHKAKRAEDPRKVVMDARRRTIGAPKGDPSLPIYGHPCGIAIDAQASSLDEALALWHLFDQIDRADAAYCGIVLGVRRFAKTAKLEHLPDRMETSADAPAPDLRCHDERHRDAMAGWAHWIARLSRIPQRKAIMATMRGLAEPVRDGKVTRDGAVMVEGLRALLAAGTKAIDIRRKAA